MDRLRTPLPAVPAPCEPGRPWPMGAQVRDGGVNFCVCSAHATRVELCLFDDPAGPEAHRLALLPHGGDLWHGFVPGAGPGQLYGLRVHGPWRPDRGHRFNPHKLLLDPWAREIVGSFEWRDEHFGGGRERPHQIDRRDNAPWALKARVVADTALSGGAARPHHALDDTVVYELHLRNFTMSMPGVPEAERGTFLGAASEPAIAHLRRLGVSAVGLLPVQQSIDEERLVRAGLRNHWGYNTIGFFCPHPRYATRPDGATARAEFRTMVRRFHEAGIEVLLDVVYNHTAEGDESGPTIAFRGLDNCVWYRLPPERRGEYENWSGCGNTIDIRQPRVLQFILDSLRYWVQEMGVDGFRFDLAPVLGRGDALFDRHAAFFQALAQDPVLAGAKLIAEPWDLAIQGHQLGAFPNGWIEWNDRFRDTMRAYWLGGDCTRGEFAERLAGSASVFQARRRDPFESLNYVVSHDGFTLHDLVSYDTRHNAANGEGNRDGHAHNLSWNCGWEGPTDDPDVLRVRSRLQRALLATVLLAQGTPMLAAGAELGHTQHGNNNPYCQDNPTSWIDWSRADDDLLAYTATVVALRRRLLPFGNRWYSGLLDANGRTDLAWRRRGGQAPTADDWGSRASRVIAAEIGVPGRSAQPLLLLFNPADTEAVFQLPAGRWRLELDSAVPRGLRPWTGDGEAPFTVTARSLVLLAAEPP